MHGWIGKIVKIDLGRGTRETVDVGDAMRRRYLGGRGLGVKLYGDLFPDPIDPLGDDNALIFMTGPLTGTMMTSGRFQIVSRSPLTGTICDSSSGGVFGQALKAAGVDGLIIRGRAAAPVYLLVQDGEVEIRDAAAFWGLDTQKTQKGIQAETPPRTSVACIGPAGENGLLFAAVMNDKDRAAGRGGMGAIMGAKNLKAVAAAGARSVEIADPAGYKDLAARVDRAVDKNPVTGKSLQLLGTSVLVNIINAHGMFPTENFRRGVFNDAEGTSGEKIAETLLQRQSACYKCPIGCGRTTKTRDMQGEGPEYETVWAFGAHLGISDLTAITEANYACNELGLDTITMGSTLGCAMELRDVGAWPEGPRWGEAGKLREWVTDTVYRRGIGAELALGSKRLAAKYGRPELAMQVKGMEIPAYDPRGVQGMALSYATSNRGGCHMRAYMIAPEILGHPVFLDRFSTAGKAELVALFQDISAMVDSTVLCRFLQFALGISTFTEMLRTVTGLDFSDEELMAVGRRIYTLERLFNNRAGFGRGDDTLPPRFFNEELATGPSRHRLVRLDEMLDDYYAVRGWDKNGAPLPQTLAELGL
ncbi:MAG: aldehyde ferredoxin oxidoreductase family protein [Candidatus Aminicenantes bacterium]|nr:aldehyde ferredoxin oxidoreductase family protein [Candidatus Aminicenantes bacterium]